ncbi:PilX N-terminal domain-containing pilus assembly protein [Planctomycetota bacterium]
MDSRSHFCRTGLQTKGIVLLVVLGVLALLSVLALTFVSMTRLERSISRNYVDHTRAMLAAESGIEYAIARIQGFQGGALTAAETEAMRYEQNDLKPGLAFATKPSFNLPAPNQDFSGYLGSTYGDKGDRFKLEVRDESGKLNINDTNGQWNIDTDPNPDSDDPAEDADADPANIAYRLEMIFEYLVERLFGDPANPSGIGTSAALALFAGREASPNGKFSGWNQVQEVLVDPDNPNLEQPLTITQFKELKSHITLWSWQDPNTIRPTHKWNITVPEGKRPIPEYAERDVYLFSDWQTKGFELEPRCPVNINTASEELLKALIAPVRGWYLREGPAETITWNHYYSYYSTYTFDASRACYFQYHYGDETNEHIMGVDWINACPAAEPGHMKSARYGEAHQTTDLKMIDNGIFLDNFVNQLYQKIHGDSSSGLAANPIESWEEFEFVIANLLDNMLPDDHEFWNEFWADWSPGPGGYEREYSGRRRLLPPDVDYQYWSRYGRKIILDLLLANFNPNSQLNDFNPDRHIFRMVDKAQLTQYTTELCFEPTGYFQINALGQVTQADGSMVASRKIHTVIKSFEIFRISTQSQFMKGLEGGSSESDLLQYCSSSPLGDTPWGTSIASYPEPLLENASGDYIPASIYDGQLMLSSYQFPLEQHVGANFQISFDGRLAPPGVGMWIKTHTSLFTNNMGVFSNDLLTFNQFLYQGPRNEPTSDRLTYVKGSQPDTVLPGVLFPDGALSDAGRALGFSGTFFGDPNVQGRRGALQFWVKPNFDTQAGGRLRKLFCFMGSSYNDSPSGSCDLYRSFTLMYLPHGQLTNLEKISPLTYFYNLEFCPPRTLAFGWGGGVSGNGSILGEFTPTAVSQLPNRMAGANETHHSYHFDPHQWSHFALRWDHTSGENYLDKVALIVNGKRPADYDTAQAAYHILEGFSDLNLYHDDNGPVYVRFGESSHYPIQNFVADSTFDEIVSYQLPGDLGLDGQSIYTQVGRYVNTENLTDTAVYLSQAWDPVKELKLGHRETLTLRSVSWTLYWPDYNERRDYYNSPSGEQENPPLMPRNVNDDAPDDPLADILGWDQAYDPVSVDIAHVDAGGNESWLADSNGNSDIYDDIANTMTYAGGSPVMLTDSRGIPLQFRRGDSFKFRVYFNVDDNQILYESPVFDDITIVFSSAKPKILIWKVIHQ